jgi:hypothetical protein
MIFGHWPLKLMALLLATLLYAGLALSESTRSFAGPVAIEVLNAPSGGALLDHPGVVDRIEFRAPDDVTQLGAPRHGRRPGPQLRIPQAEASGARRVHPRDRERQGLAVRR